MEAAGTASRDAGEALIIAAWHTDVDQHEAIFDPDRQRELCRRAQGGDTSARDELVNGSLRLVESIARKYARGGGAVPLSDLIQQGAIGLLRAIQLFDCEREGARFATYASWWIQQPIARAALADDSTIWIPDRVQTHLMHTRRGTPVPPSAQPVSAADLAAARRARYVASLDAPLLTDDESGGDESTLYDVLHASGEEGASVEALAFSHIDGEALARVFMAALLPSERRLLVLHYGLFGTRPYSLAHAGRLLGYSRQRAEQLKRRALGKLRQPHIMERLRQAVTAA